MIRIKLIRNINHVFDFILFLDKLKDIKGITYGKVSETFLKECNKKLLPWLCFSLILQKRTLDFYCTDQIDPLIWLPGLTAALAGQTLTLKIPKKKLKLKDR